MVASVSISISALTTHLNASEAIANEARLRAAVMNRVVVVVVVFIAERLSLFSFELCALMWVVH